MNTKDANIFEPGAIWKDTGGQPIQAHGGGILFDRGTYYWFGENKNGETRRLDDGTFRVDVIGISCYSSKDLVQWKNEGIVLPADSRDPAGDLHPSKVLERPKVIYNARTKQYVMWVHIDNHNYKLARAGVAVSDRPTGPYYYVRSTQPNHAEARDMTVFQDDDGRAYLIYSSESHGAMHVSLLTDDYLAQSGKFTRNFLTPPLKGREAPAIFKYDGKYFMITSACTGWDPNPAEYAMASDMLGDWSVRGNPCVGPGSETTFNSQSTFVLPVVGKPGSFIFMADRWNKHNLGDSRYIWLPFKMFGDSVCVRWMDRWRLSDLD